MDIFTAAKNGDTGFISRFIATGGNIDTDDHNSMTPLHLAIDNRRAEAIRLLVKAGARLDRKDRWGQTALILAAGRNDAATVKLLIAAGADLGAKAANGLTALGYAVDNGFREIAALLKKRGAR
jgi:ankyrin repeat protein